MLGAYTVIEEEPNATTHSGEEFASFDEANQYAFEWASDQWPDAIQEKNVNGIYRFDKISIYVEMFF